MKVYILWTGYEDIEGIFSTREKAEAHRDKHLALHKSRWRTIDNYSIVECTIDEPDPL